jgi:hypothetical protein
MLDSLLLGALIASALFLFYELWKLKNSRAGFSLPGTGILPEPGKLKNLYTGMSDIELKVKVENLESLVADFEKRIDRQEKVISGLINELSG